MKKLTILPLVLLLILMAAVAVHADRPEVFQDEDIEEDFQVVACTDSGHDFEVWDHLVGHQNAKGYFDNEGNLVKVIWKFQGVDHLYNRSRPDYIAKGPFNLTAHVYPHPDWSITIENVVGVWWNIQLPGKGAVYHESGLSRNIDLWVDGEEQLLEVVKRAGLEKSDSETLCEFFAQ
ncbi:MAG TPA: hypothetical protein PKD98_25675 [Anaerolineae bacterium]|nr:hypothetical protein [Anaerolineae bacterium]